MNNLLYRKLQKKNYQAKHVAEIGVYHPNTSNIVGFIADGIKATLFEPDPESISLIEEAFKDYSHVQLHRVAICDQEGEVELCRQQASTFMTSLPRSPSIVNDGCQVKADNCYSVTGKRLSSLDPGDFDVISIDVEGAEWYAIKHMRSRPNIISIETHGGGYINPYIDDLKDWLNCNNYIIWFKDKSDSVYIKQGVFPVSKAEKCNLIYRNVKNTLQFIKKRMKSLVS